MNRCILTGAFLLVLFCGWAGCRSTSPLQPPLNHVQGNPAWATAATNAGTTRLVELQDTSQFRQLVNRPQDVVLVDFYADWCEPCSKQSEVLRDVAAGGRQAATIVKVNVDQHPQLVDQFQVSGLPTLVLFKNGGPISRKTGFADYREVTSLLTQ